MHALHCPLQTFLRYVLLLAVIMLGAGWFELCCHPSLSSAYLFVTETAARLQHLTMWCARPSPLAAWTLPLRHHSYEPAL